MILAQDLSNGLNDFKDTALLDGEEKRSKKDCVTIPINAVLKIVIDWYTVMLLINSKGKITLKLCKLQKLKCSLLLWKVLWHILKITGILKR